MQKVFDSMNDYTQGQLDLIQDIKEKVAKLEETTTIQDFPFDVLHLLKSIKPYDFRETDKGAIK